jgi:HK97 family phage major capsid protein
MTLTELKEQKSAKRNEADELLKLAETEERDLTEEEQVQYDEIIAELEKIEEEMAEKEDELRSIKVKNTHAEKRFSLFKAVKAEVERRSFSDTDQKYINAGKEEMRRAGLPITGSIVVPVNYRGTIQATVVGAGIENVPTDKLAILPALRDKLVMVGAGAQFLTGLVGNLSLPKYSGSIADWASETGSAVDAGGNFTEVTWSPKRLTAKLKISKQFLAQDSHDAEALLQSDLIAAVSDKLEKTLLGDGVGSATTPAGLASYTTPLQVGTYGDLVGLEGSLEASNVLDFKYLLNPSTKASFRTMAKEAGMPIYIYDDVNNQISGHDAYTSNNINNSTQPQFGYMGDWKEYIIAQFGAGLDVVVDPYTNAGEGVINLVVNMYVDGKPRRNEAFRGFYI